MTWRYMSRAAGRPRDARRVVIVKQGYGKNWPAARKAALERDEYRCVKCGHIGKRNHRNMLDVHVDHIIKIKCFVDSSTGIVDYEAANALSNLQTLCKTCHRVKDGHTRMQGFQPLQ